jgi:signal transduction histidine kinase
METKKRRQLRREYYIYREIQLKYIRLCLLLMVLVCLIMAYTIQETWGGIIVKKLSMVCPAENVYGFYSFFNSTLLLRLLIMIPVIVVATMYLSHRVAGPVFRLEKDLVEISRGDLSRRIVLRKTDDLKKLAAEINRFIHRMDAHLSTLKSGLSRLRDSVTGARQEGVRSQEIEPRLKEWADSLDKIAQELSRFKTSS